MSASVCRRALLVVKASSLRWHSTMPNVAASLLLRFLSDGARVLAPRRVGAGAGEWPVGAPRTKLVRRAVSYRPINSSCWSSSSSDQSSHWTRKCTCCRSGESLGSINTTRAQTRVHAPSSAVAPAHASCTLVWARSRLLANVEAAFSSALGLELEVLGLVSLYFCLYCRRASMHCRTLMFSILSGACSHTQSRIFRMTRLTRSSGVASGENVMGSLRNGGSSLPGLPNT